MGIIEIVGYVGDGVIECCECARKNYEDDCREPQNFQGTFKEWLAKNDLQAVTDQEDFGPEGYYCDCGKAIQESYCPQCCYATGTFGEICDNCKTNLDDADETTEE